MEEEAATKTDRSSGSSPRAGLCALRAGTARALPLEHHDLEKPGSVDEMIQDTCFQQLLATVEKCTEAGIFPKAREQRSHRLSPVGRDARGGVATCHQAMAAVGDVDDLVEQMLRAAVIGNAVAGGPSACRTTRLGRCSGTAVAKRSVS